MIRESDDVPRKVTDVFDPNVYKSKAFNIPEPPPHVKFDKEKRAAWNKYWEHWTSWWHDCMEDEWRKDQKYAAR